jgi:hypothetical protein
MAGLFDDVLAPSAGQPATAAAPSSGNVGLFDDVITQGDRDTVDRRNKLKQIAYQSMTGDLGSKDANDLMSLGDIGIDKYSWGAARPLTAAINAFSGQGFPADSTFGERYGASESAYDRKIAEDRARTGGVGKMVGGVGTVASLFGPAEIGALTKAGDVIKGATEASGPVRRWLGAHSFKPALDIGTGSAVQGASESSGGAWDRTKAALTKGVENAVVAGIASPVISVPAQGAARVLARPASAAFNAIDRPLNAAYDYLTGGAKAAEAAAPAATAATETAPSAAAPSGTPESLPGWVKAYAPPATPAAAAAPVAADVGAPAATTNGPGAFRNALGFIDRNILHPGAVFGAGSAVTTGAGLYGADPVTASILGGATTAGLGGLKAALRVASQQGAEDIPAALSVPTRENLARLRALGVIRDASNLGTAAVFANAPGGGGGGGGY